MSASSAKHIDLLNDDEARVAHCLREEKKPTGNCYQAAWRLAMTIRDTFPSPETRLVHGTVFSPVFKRPIDHAWVRLNADIICDPSQGIVVRASEWERIARPVINKEFTLDEASRYAIKTGHYGPWKRERP